MRYKLEIIADSVGELMTKTRITLASVSMDSEFIRRVEKRGIGSIFFTEHSNIIVIDDSEEEKDFIGIN